MTRACNKLIYIHIRIVVSTHLIAQFDGSYSFYVSTYKFIFICFDTHVKQFHDIAHRERTRFNHQDKIKCVFHVGFAMKILLCWWFMYHLFLSQTNWNFYDELRTQLLGFKEIKIYSAASAFMSHLNLIYCSNQTRKFILCVAVDE